MEKRKLEFWYEFASTYSYLSATRIEHLAKAADVEISWRPFLLGPIFQSQGWTTSPFNIYPAKGRYMVRDITRIAASRGRTFKMPETFPANGLLAARIALVGEADGWIGSFSKAVYVAQFENGSDIADLATLSDILTSLNLEAGSILAKAHGPDIKARLREQSTQAQSVEIFGAPSFRTPDGELFWGDDRLELALDWTRRA
jgi:2-hydroxychromene-2-carboxylate isomerase